MKEVEFTAVVRKNRGILETGKICSVKLLPFVGKKVSVKVKIIEEVNFSDKNNSI